MKPEKLCLSTFAENPDNPQTVLPEDFDRLVEKVRRNPDGLRAHRLAYVTDHPAGPRVVIAGNKRLRALKRIYGERGMIPAEWTQDVTALPARERAIFLVSSNVVEGEFDADRLLADFGVEPLAPLVGPDMLARLVEKAETATPAEPETVKLTFALSPEDFLDVSGFLRRYDPDPSAAFARLVREETEGGAA